MASAGLKVKLGTPFALPSGEGRRDAPFGAAPRVGASCPVEEPTPGPAQGRRLSTPPRREGVE